MAKWSKQKYKIELRDGPKVVEGVVCGQWGIDKRNNQYYVLTYVPKGWLVESGRTQKLLKDLAESGEFTNWIGGDTTPLKQAIKKFRDEYGWNK